MTHTLVGYDRPDVGNKAWLNLGAIAEARPMAPTTLMLVPVRDYIVWLEDQVRSNLDEGRPS